MIKNDDVSDVSPAPRYPGWGTLAGVLTLYVAAVLIATYPAVLTAGTRLAVGELTDPLQHLWELRWYRHCLIAGQSPFFCPDVQRPVGSPLGLYSPLQLQLFIYLTLSLFTSNDVILYNSILFLQLLFTGLASFLLTWYLIRHRAGATLAGLLVMLSAPMTFNALCGGTELLALGGFPLFLIAWMRLVDRPSRGRLAAAVSLFLLLETCASYYGILGIFPAALYVAMQAFGTERRGLLTWIRDRVGWLAVFALLILLAIPLIFPVHLWAVAQGYPLSRPREQFEQYGTTLWHYVMPWFTNSLANAVMPQFWLAPGFRDRPTVYVGIVTLALLVYAAAKRVQFPRSGFLWVSLVMLVVLSLGASTTIGDHKIPLPALWLWDHVPPFRSLRIPARFGYFAVVCAAVLAGGAFKTLLDRAGRGRRTAIFVATIVLTLADLSAAPYGTQAIPPVLDCYARILRDRPKASFLEVHPTESYLLYRSTLAYWQSLHGGRTTAGNPGVVNRRQEELAVVNSPFPYRRLNDPKYLAHAGFESFDIVRDTEFSAYVWLFLTVHDFDDMILHQWTWDHSPPPAPMMRIKGRLNKNAIVFEDDATVVFDRRRLDAPARPVLVCTEGWWTRVLWDEEAARIASDNAHMPMFNPNPNRALTFRLRAMAHRRPRTVTLLADGREITHWRIDSHDATTFVSPPFHLPAGLHDLSLKSDGQERPARQKTASSDVDMTPFSLWVSGVQVNWEDANVSPFFSVSPSPAPL